jgi:hypothetical protein
MLFKERVASYCENRTENTRTICGKNAEIHTYANHWAVKG